MQQTILEKALTRFMESGFNRVTTDDLSGDLGISKKTLYKYYETKDALVDAVFEYLMNSIRKKIEAVTADPDLNALHKLEKMFETISDYVFRVSKQTFVDLQKSRPDLFQKMLDFRARQVKRNLQIMMEQGQREGLIREDLDITLAIDMFLAVINGIMVPDYLINSSHTPKTAFKTIYTTVLNGIIKR